MMQLAKEAFKDTQTGRSKVIFVHLLMVCQFEMIEEGDNESSLRFASDSLEKHNCWDDDAEDVAVPAGLWEADRGAIIGTVRE